MSFKEALLDAGFSPSEAEKLAAHEHFRQRNSNKTGTEIAGNILFISMVYEISITEIREAILTFPPFAGYDHQRVLNGIREAYKCTTEQAAKAILTHPPFAGYDHQRVIRQLTRIGRKIGLSSNKVKEKILGQPRLAGYSARRYLAVIDVFRHLGESHAIPNDRLLDLWVKRNISSPYVPDSNRLRITQVSRNGMSHKEPPLMTAIRPLLRKHKERLRA